jgi:hypothetical protein
MSNTTEITPDPVLGDRTFTDDSAAGDAVMKKIRWNESLAKARATLQQFEGCKERWERERVEAAAARAKKDEQDRIMNRQIAAAQSRRRRAPKFIYKTQDPARSAAHKAKLERHRASLVEAARHLVGHPGSEAFVQKHLPQQSDELIYKTQYSAPSPSVEPAPPRPVASPASFASDDPITALYRAFPPQQADALAAALDCVCGIVGSEVGEIEKGIRNDFRRALERVPRGEKGEPGRSIIGPPGPRGDKGEGAAELEQRVAALEQHIVRKSKPRGGTTDFDFNEARALTRN